MIPLAKNIKRYFSFKELAIVLVAVIVSVAVGIAVFVSLKKDVVINDNGKQIVVKTMKTTVREVLAQNCISISPDDFISKPLDTELQKITENQIYIKRAVPVTVFVDGQERKLMTYRDTVKEALENSSIKLSVSDKLDGATLGDKIVKGMNFKIIRVREEYLTENISIPFKVINQENNHLDKGKQRTVREGKEGIREKLYRMVFEDGKEVLKEMVKDSVALAPVNRMVEFGTILNFKTSRGDVVRYKKVLDMRSTAYTASYEDTGKHPGDPGFGITFTGARVKEGIIAVDPRVIPLGTRVYIEGLGSTSDYGFAIAADIGGAIKGNKIDLYYDTKKEVARWGVRNVKVYILLD